MKTHLFTLLISIVVATQLHGQLSVADARLAGAGATVTTKGLVTNGAELGTIRYFQDNTGGLAVYDNAYAASISRGDSIEVTGLLADYNGLLEITSLTSMVIINSGNALPEPQLFTPAQIGEDEEGELVRVNDILFTNAGGVFAGNTTYAFNAGSETLNIFVRNGSPLIGQPIPGGTVDMIGISSQYQTNYQVLPRDISDFFSGPGIAIMSSFTQTNMNYNGFNVNWTTNIPGSTGVLYGLTPALELGNEFDINPVTDHSYPLLDLEAGQIYYCQGYSIANGDTVYTPIRPFVTISNSSGTMTAYFNTGVDNSVATTQNAVQLYEAIDDTLIAYINRAELSLDLTIYDFNNTNVSNVSEAINAAADRGVQVRFISDGSLAATNTGIGELSPMVNHIYSPVGDAYNIMHNKFVIIDANHPDPMKTILWSGSTNWTERQLYTDNNSVIIIQDQALARTYTLEFNEMWGSTAATPDTSQSRFGSFKQDNTPHEFIIGNKRVESYFSPSDNVNSQLINTINTADSSAYFASMLITRYDVAQALIDKHAAGVTVQGIIDSPTSTSQYDILSAEMGVDLHVNPDTTIIMHHKHLIVDYNQPANDPLLWVGSHNWSSNANTRNDENTLVIHDENIANQYYQEFVALISFQPVSGCTNPTACNFNSAATIDDASCLFLATPCDDGDPNTINDVVNFSCECEGVLMVVGCTDITACNFSPGANTNDNSCLYTGTTCDDGSAETINDVINADCQCEGIVNSIEEWKDAAELNVFPNPAGDRLNIRFTSALGGMATLTVSDITGNVCFTQPTSFGPGTSVKSIDLTQLPAGTYLIGLTIDSGSLQLGFVKQ
jgi:phosphatidylserine/phosphatidylglycerophosphate/cardiolipin synthase-like enzyme/DNA/RNA endonuclease YhcR with UshA esterase domain